MKKTKMTLVIVALIAIIAVFITFLFCSNDAPTISISEDGYWVINGEKTDVSAKGEKGDKDDKGDGSSSANENPQGLHFYPQDDGTYVVSCGDAQNLSNIVIPATYKGGAVVGVDYSAFSSCTGLTSITVDEDNTSYQSIDGNLYSKDGKTLIQYAIDKKNTSFTIPDSVTSIGGYAFHSCTGLTSIVIHDSVETIGEYAFANCSNLSEITLGESLRAIGYRAFLDCTGLTDVYYTGTEAEWEKISIDYNNEYLTRATRHYNYVPAN